MHHIIYWQSNRFCVSNVCICKKAITLYWQWIERWFQLLLSLLKNIPVFFYLTSLIFMSWSDFSTPMMCHRKLNVIDSMVINTATGSAEPLRLIYGFRPFIKRPKNLKRYSRLQRETLGEENKKSTSTFKFKTYLNQIQWILDGSFCLNR